MKIQTAESGVKFLAFMLPLLAACSSAPAVRPEQEAALKQANDAAQLREQLEVLNNRIDSLEGKLSSVTDKVDAARQGVENLMTFQKPRDIGVPAQPTQSAGVPVETSPALNDPEAGLVNDTAIRAYRQAMILYRAGKYPESILAFSSFIESYADHPLAGSAQYHVGESYHRQKEYKLAVAEYQRVLTSYDRSSAIPDTLKRIAEAEDQIRQGDEALKHRQLLLSLFPQSPAARSVQLTQAAPERAAPEPAGAVADASQAAPKTNAGAASTGAPAVPTPAALDEVPPTAPMPAAPAAPTVEPRAP